MADMIVSGAGSSDSNGTYVESGESSGKPEYSMGDQRIRWSGTQWEIRYYKYFMIDYYSTDDVATPDLCTTWQVGGHGLSPVPTVTASGGGSSGNPYHYYAQLG